MLVYMCVSVLAGGRLDPASMAGISKHKRSLEALGTAGLRSPLRMASTSSYVGAQGNGKIERHVEMIAPTERTKSNEASLTGYVWTPARSETSTIMDIAKIFSFFLGGD